MTQLHVVSSLVKKHSELQGSITQAENQLHQLRNTLKAVEVSINLFEPEYKFSTIHAKRTNNRLTQFRRGEISQIVGEFVRLAADEFLTTDVTQVVIEKKEGLLTEKDKQKVRDNVFKCLRGLADKGIIQELSQTGKGSTNLWRSPY